MDLNPEPDSYGQEGPMQGHLKLLLNPDIRKRARDFNVIIETYFNDFLNCWSVHFVHGCRIPHTELFRLLQLFRSDYDSAGGIPLTFFFWLTVKYIVFWYHLSFSTAKATAFFFISTRR